MREDLLAKAAAANLAAGTVNRNDAVATLNAAIVQAERRLLLEMTI